MGEKCVDPIRNVFSALLGAVEKLVMERNKYLRGRKTP